MSINDRATAIAKYREALIANKKEIVALLVKETGKVQGNAEYDFDMLTGMGCILLIQGMIGV